MQELKAGGEDIAVNAKQAIHRYRAVVEAEAGLMHDPSIEVDLFLRKR